MTTPDFVNILNLIAQPVNFFAHLITFCGAFYLIFHHKNMPKWHITPLWWAGLASLFTWLTIVLGLYFGDDFTFSYHRFGFIGETLLNAFIAFIAAMFMHRTIKAEKINRNLKKKLK